MNPSQFEARQEATLLLLAIEQKLNELSELLAKTDDPQQKELIVDEIRAQKWHHDQVRHDCERKGWL